MDKGIGTELRSRFRRSLITAGLEMSAALERAGLMRHAGGLGAVFTLHHVRPFTRTAFQPNRHLEVSPEFLDLAIRRLKAAGFRFAALSELPDLVGGKVAQRFAAFTLDDGNRNNVDHALPVFARHGVPFTVFVTQGLSERTHGMWWETLAELLGRLDRIGFDFGAGRETIDLAGIGQRQRAFDRLAAYISNSDEADAVQRIDVLARSHGVEPLDIAGSLIMSAAELRALASHPLASLGAHTVSHRALSRLGETEAASEISASADYVEAISHVRPTAIAYPYGTSDSVSRREARLAADLGFTVGLTTRPGTITPLAASDMMMLPRLSLNGFYQRPRYAAALASGIPVRLRGGGS
jgi:peptidoglycan/xylan/chitin deacetylase (PgdA/CDA1 family)